jgi:hypothetical protein
VDQVHHEKRILKGHIPAAELGPELDAIENRGRIGKEDVASVKIAMAIDDAAFGHALF